MSWGGVVDECSTIVIDCGLGKARYFVYHVGCHVAAEKE